jgi:predicted anti-sigma-YlaC factor YlaD
MTCSDCQAVLSDYLERRLPDETRRRVALHLAACPACRAECEAERLLDTVLAEAPLKAPPADFTTRVLARTRRAPRAAHAAYLKAAGYLASAAALLAGLRQMLLGLPESGTTVTEAGLSPEIALVLPKAGAQTVGTAARLVEGLVGGALSAPGRWSAALPDPADAAALSTVPLLCVVSVVVLTALSGILYAALRQTRAPS